MTRGYVELTQPVGKPCRHWQGIQYPTSCTSRFSGMHVKLRQPVAAAGVSALNRPHVKATRQSTLGSSIQSHPFAPSFRSYGLNGVQLASRKGFSMSCLSLMPCFQGTTFRVGRRRNTVTKTHRFEPCSGLQCTLIRRTHPGHCDLVEEWRAASKDGTSNFPWTEDDLLPIARLECGGGEPNAEHIAMVRRKIRAIHRDNNSYR